MPGKKKPFRREATLPECGDGQLFARVTKLLGNYRILVYCNDDQERMALIRGTLRKKVWIAVGDIVLISLREGMSSDDKADVCDRLDPKLVYQLKKVDPTINPKLFVDHESKAMKGESIHEKEDATGFEFGEESVTASATASATASSSDPFDFDAI